MLECVICRRVSLQWVAWRNAPHKATLDFLQGLDRPAGGKDEALLNFTLRALLLQILVVKPFQKLPRGGDAGKLVAQAALQAFIPNEQSQVLRALSAHGLKQGNRFDELGLGKPALALAQAEVGSDQFWQAQGPKGARDTQRAGVRTGRLLQGAGVQDERGLVQQGQSGSHRGAI